MCICFKLAPFNPPPRPLPLDAPVYLRPIIVSVLATFVTTILINLRDVSQCRPGPGSPALYRRECVGMQGKEAHSPAHRAAIHQAGRQAPGVNLASLNTPQSLVLFPIRRMRHSNACRSHVCSLVQRPNPNNTHWRSFESSSTSLNANFYYS